MDLFKRMRGVLVFKKFRDYVSHKYLVENTELLKHQFSKIDYIQNLNKILNTILDQRIFGLEPEFL